MANKTGDSGINTTVTTRLAVFATGMPAAAVGTAIGATSPAAGTDYGVATATSARPDVCDPPTGTTNPPSAAVDIGSA